MATSTQIKANVDEFIIDPTSPQSVTRANVGGIIKSTVDYTDQEISDLRTEVTNDIAEQITGVYQAAGSWDASVATFPTTGTGASNAVEAGDVYRVSVSGTIGGVSYSVGDSFYALINNPGQTAGNWDRFNYNAEEATTSTLGIVLKASDADVGAGTGGGMVSSSQLQDKIDNLPDPVLDLGYKDYRVRLQQTGTSAPLVATIYKNNATNTAVPNTDALYRAIVFQRTSVGLYKVLVRTSFQASVTIPSSKIELSFSDAKARHTAISSGTDGVVFNYVQLDFETRDITGVLSDGVLVFTNVYIRIYN